MAPEPRGTHVPTSPASSNGRSGRGSQPDRCRPEQSAAIRTWLKRTHHSEDEILRFYGCKRLEELSTDVADRVIRRLVELKDGTFRSGHESGFPQ